MSAEIPLDHIRFMQASASGIFQDRQHDIIENAKALQAGTLKITNMPKIEVWQDDQGRIWTTNHRRLITLLLSGIADKIPVAFVDEAVVKQNAYEFTTTNEGKKIYVWLTDEVAMIVGNDNRCHLSSKG